MAADEELGDREMALAHQWQAGITTDDIRYRLRAVLQAPEIAERFDFILLDCPPRLTTACMNALSASDYVIVPVLPSPTFRQRGAAPAQVAETAAPAAVPGAFGDGRDRQQGEIPPGRTRAEAPSRARFAGRRLPGRLGRAFEVSGADAHA